MSCLPVITLPKCYTSNTKNPVSDSKSTIIRCHKFNLPVNTAAFSTKSISSVVNIRRKCQSSSNTQVNQREGEIEKGGEDETLVEDLRVPDQWLLPSKALEESEWLRVTLHKWLDDEYCPEDTNVEISQVAAQSYYESLQEKRTDLGEILLNMARELESISYQESFHGPFSSANAAVNLIAQRIEQA